MTVEVRDPLEKNHEVAMCADVIHTSWRDRNVWKTTDRSEPYESLTLLGGVKVSC